LEVAGALGVVGAHDELEVLATEIRRVGLQTRARIGPRQTLERVAERRPAGNEHEPEPSQGEQDPPTRRVARGLIPHPYAGHDERGREHQQTGDDRGDETPGERDAQGGRAPGRREQHEERSGTHGWTHHPRRSLAARPAVR
jgi:hypothetical protein